jgi:hypothetical protein
MEVGCKQRFEKIWTVRFILYKSVIYIRLGPFWSRFMGGFGSVNDPVLARIRYKIFKNGTIIPIPFSPVTRSHPPRSHPWPALIRPALTRFKPATRTRSSKPVKPGRVTRDTRTRHPLDPDDQTPYSFQITLQWFENAWMNHCNGWV